MESLCVFLICNEATIKKNVDYELDLLALWGSETVADNVAADGTSFPF